jgi:hypothetical protein
MQPWVRLGVLGLRLGAVELLPQRPACGRKWLRVTSLKSCPEWRTSTTYDVGATRVPQGHGAIARQSRLIFTARVVGG